MKKIILSLLAGSLLMGACRKTRDDVVSQIENESYPTITFTGSQYYSINTGGSLPTVSATAYDSTLKESYSVEINGTEGLDNTTPGLYVVNATSKNKFGYITNEAVFVAVTDIPDAVNLAGNYKRVSNNAPVTVTRLARGLYLSDNISGAVSVAAGSPGLFVQINDTTIDVPLQNSEAFGEFEAINETLRMQPGDTVYSYILSPATVFAQNVRVFQKL